MKKLLKKIFNRRSYLDDIKDGISDKPYMPSERVMFFPRETDQLIPVLFSAN
jgi:hypothetical protein